MYSSFIRRLGKATGFPPTSIARMTAVEKLSTIKKAKSTKPTAYSLLVRTSVDAAASFDFRVRLHSVELFEREAG